MAHRVHPILLFDVIEAMFLIPKIDKSLSTQDLISIHACQLQKHLEDPAVIKEHFLKSCYTSLAQFKKDHTNLIVGYDFKEVHSFWYATQVLRLTYHTKTNNDILDLFLNPTLLSVLYPTSYVPEPSSLSHYLLSWVNWQP